MEKILPNEKRFIENLYSQREKAEEWASLENRPEAAEDLARIDLNDRDVLADLGCGSGYHSLAAAKICKRVHCVDISEEMISLLENNIAQSGHNNIVPHLGGLLEINYLAFDITKVFTSGTLHHLPDAWKGELFSKLAQALPAGALFLLQDVIYSFALHERDIYQAQFMEEVLELHGPEVASDLRNTYENEFPTYDWILIGLLERSGFMIKGLWSLPCKCWSCILCQKAD